MNKKQPVIKLTQAYFDQIKKRYDELQEYRDEVLVRLQDAREKGDLSENGAYTAARFELNDTDRELRRIKKLLLYGKVVVPEDNGIAEFGNAVTLSTGKSSVTYQLVSEHESDPSKKKLSVKSPLGMAIMGKHEGDEVEFDVPAGKKRFTIVSVE